MKTVKKSFEYGVDEGPIRLTVTIGQGQLGATAVFRGDDELASAGIMLSLLLGQAEDLVDSDVVVDSVVQDVLSQTNRMTVEYVLEGGAKKETFVSRTTVAKDLDLCRFTTTISFVRS